MAPELLWRYQPAMENLLGIGGCSEGGRWTIVRSICFTITVKGRYKRFKEEGP